VGSTSEKMRHRLAFDGAACTCSQAVPAGVATRQLHCPWLLPTPLPRNDWLLLWPS
jgi:hypothetical protein